LRYTGLPEFAKYRKNNKVIHLLALLKGYDYGYDRRKPID